MSAEAFVKEWVINISRVVAGQLLPINVSLSEHFLLVGKTSSKNTKFGAGNPLLRGICGHC